MRFRSVATALPRLKIRLALWGIGAGAAFAPALFDLARETSLDKGPWISLMAGILFVTVAGFADIVVIRRKGLASGFQQFVSRCWAG